MSARERARDRGQRHAERLSAALASELREARLAAGVSQRHVAQVTGLSQSRISRTERSSRRVLTIAELAVHAEALGLRLHVRTYPTGSPVRDAAQLALLKRFRSRVDERFTWRSEVPVGGQGDLRAWDVLLDCETPIAVDAETRLRDIQALQRRLELKWRDSRVPRLVLLVAGTHHNRRVIREHRAALLSTLPLDTADVLRALCAGEAPSKNGIVLL